MSRKAVIVIPAFDPPREKLGELLAQLYEKVPEQKILLFNDGSKEQFRAFLEDLPLQYPHLTLLSRRKNCGKGVALRESFAYILKNFPSSPIVTADCDGQHAPEDILRITLLAEETKEELILGVRDLSSRDIPFRSKWGNLLIRKIFYLLSGVRLQDTQTGLRALSPAFAASLLERCRGERYEFEMECLWEAYRQGIPIREERIATLYMDSNRGSHFGVFRDPFLICGRLIAGFLKR